MRSSISLLFVLATAASCGSLLPSREEPAGDCLSATSCPAERPVCDNNQCRPCRAHGECASLVCDSYGDLSGVGTCVPESDILYIDAVAAGEVTCSGTGTREKPLCDIAGGLEKLAAIPSGKKRPILRLLPSANAYQTPVLDAAAGPVVLVGSGEFSAGRAATLSTDGNDTLRFGDNATVTLDGVIISSYALSAPAGGKLSIRRSKLQYLYGGASFTNATVTLDRDWFTASTLGLAFQGATVNITNSLFTGNTSRRPARRRA